MVKWTEDTDRMHDELVRARSPRNCSPRGDAEAIDEARWNELRKVCEMTIHPGSERNSARFKWR